MVTITPGGALGQSALALGISPGVIQNLFGTGSLETFVQGRIAQRNLASAQQSFQTSFNVKFAEQAAQLEQRLAKTFQTQQEQFGQQRESLLVLQQETKQKVEAQQEAFQTQKFQIRQRLETQQIRTESEGKVTTKTNIIPLLLIGAALLG